MIVQDLEGLFTLPKHGFFFSNDFIFRVELKILHLYGFQFSRLWDFNFEEALVVFLQRNMEDVFAMFLF